MRVVDYPGRRVTPECHHVWLVTFNGDEVAVPFQTPISRAQIANLLIGAEALLPADWLSNDEAFRIAHLLLALTNYGSREQRLQGLRESGESAHLVTDEARLALALARDRRNAASAICALSSRGCAAATAALPSRTPVAVIGDRDRVADERVHVQLRQMHLPLAALSKWQA